MSCSCSGRAYVLRALPAERVLIPPELKGTGSRERHWWSKSVVELLDHRGPQIPHDQVVAGERRFVEIGVVLGRHVVIESAVRSGGSLVGTGGDAGRRPRLTRDASSPLTGRGGSRRRRCRRRRCPSYGRAGRRGGLLRGGKGLAGARGGTLSGPRGGRGHARTRSRSP